MSDKLPAITGRQLIRLFRLDGWQEGRRTTHGISFRKRLPDGTIDITIIPSKNDPLTIGTLSAILGPKQSRIGRNGLLDLIDRFGL